MTKTKETKRIKYISLKDTEVMETMEYSVFILDKKNRPINEEKVKSFMREFKKGRFYMKEFPAIVNENFVILDGQHRFDACRQMQLPFLFRLTDKLTIDNVIDIQSNAGWSTMDYVHAYIKQEKQDYIVLYRFMNRYKLTATSAVYLLRNNFAVGLLKCGFYEGNFVVVNETKAHKFAKMINEIQDLISIRATQKNFVIAVAKSMSTPDFNDKRMIEQMTKYGSLMKQQVTTDDFIRNLELVYNYHLAQINKARFL